MSGGERGHTIGDGMKDKIMKDGIMKEKGERSTTKEEDAISAVKLGVGLLFYF